MEPIKLDLPIYIEVNKKTTFALNLNQYRNTNFHTLNKAKVLFDQAVQPLLTQLPTFESLHLTYTLFFGSKREVDTSNVCCIVDKFFSDSLTHSGKITDDNHKIIKSIKYEFGGVDTKNPRVEVTIHDYEVIEPMKEEPVRITLVEREIKEALTAYVFAQIAIKDGQSVEIEFKNTRGEDGATAEINIVNNAGTKPVSALTPATQIAIQQDTSAPKEAPVEELKETVKESDPSNKVVAEPLSEAVAEAEKEQTTEPKAEEPATNPRSLFGNLTRPTNG